MSFATTQLGPRVSVGTDNTNDSAAVGKADLSGSKVLIRTATSAATSAGDWGLEDGQIELTLVAASGASLAVRSGNTIYLIDTTGTIAV